MLELIIMLSMLLKMTNPEIVPVDDPRSHLLEHHEIDYGKINAYIDVGTIYIKPDRLDPAMTALEDWRSDGLTPGTSLAGPVRTIVHEMLHLYDYEDDGQLNGSPAPSIPRGTDDPAHYYVHWALDSRCITPGRCIDTLGTADVVHVP